MKPVLPLQSAGVLNRLGEAGQPQGSSRETNIVKSFHFCKMIVMGCWGDGHRSLQGSRHQERVRMSYRIARRQAIVMAMVVLLASAAAAETPLGIDGGRLVLSTCRRVPPVSLRGYGPLSGCPWTASGRPSQASLLQINCASGAKAQLLLAKYLSDLDLLPGVGRVQMVTKRGLIAARSIESQGAVAACGRATAS